MQIANRLRAEIERALGGRTFGVYLFGSLATGDFDPGRSDVDLLVAHEGELDGRDVDFLRTMHERFSGEHPAFADRIDAVYVSRRSLSQFSARAHPIVTISADEPLRRVESSPGWAMNWYSVRESGVALLGPPPCWIEAIEWRDFLRAVRAQMEEMVVRVEGRSDAGFLAYAVLSGCRALHALDRSRQASKRAAATWARVRFPEWTGLIDRSLALRSDPGGSLSHADALRFVGYVAATLAEPRPASDRRGPIRESP